MFYIRASLPLALVGSVPEPDRSELECRLRLSCALGQVYSLTLSFLVCVVQTPMAQMCSEMQGLKEVSTWPQAIKGRCHLLC